MEILGAQGPPMDPLSRLSAARSLGEVQLLDARLVCGRDHLVTALEHAERAMREGRNVAKSLAMEFVVYASGERQIDAAIRKMGVRADTTEFAIVTLGPEASLVLEALSLARDDRVLAASDAKLRTFGIGVEESSTVPEDCRADLVLERVALVDLLK